MDLADIVRRTPVPEPWAEGEKIPWDEPAFSARMLAEHLSQAHDAASRRSETIAEHVDWIHTHVLTGQPSRILDLGCGPGLYTAALAELGHACVGVDFGPASIDYARSIAGDKGLACDYRFGDIRTVDFGTGFDLVMLIFGEFNVFSTSDAQVVLQKAHEALRHGGRIILEVHTFDAVRRVGMAGQSWRAADRGLFSDRPHLRLEESFWDDESRTATERYYIIDADSAEVTRYAQSMQAYSDDEFRECLEDAGFRLDAVIPSMRGVEATGDEGDFIVLLATRC